MYSAITKSINNPKVILITGASSGIGKCCFDFLQEQGYVVYGTSRNESNKTHMLQMDVTNYTSIEKAIQYIIEREARLDVLVNNAGISIVGAIEDTSMTEAQRIMDTNFWGILRTTRAVLPAMREQNSGLIINISSLAGLFAIPFQSFYSASKFALEGFTESLRMEIRSFGIHACLIEPGDFRTKISENRIFTNQSNDTSNYFEKFESAKKVIVSGERNGEHPEKIARLVAKLILTKNPKVRYRIGKLLDLLAAILKPVLPQKIFEWLIRNHYGL